MDSKTYESPIAASPIWVSKDNFEDYNNERYLYDVSSKQDSSQSSSRIVSIWYKKISHS